MIRPELMRPEGLRPEVLRPDVLIIGGGPAGLSAARALAPKVDGGVVVVDREVEAGGVPRSSAHLGYGVRDLHRMLTGPAYARRLARAAEGAGAVIRTQATVTDWSPEGGAEVTTPRGRLLIQPRATVLATGARERPRAARMIPGDRPAGIYTTGHLQNLVHLFQRPVGRRAVIVGAEPVSWSAVLTLRHAGCAVALMVTRHRSPESYAAFTVPGRAVLRVPLATRSRVIRIIGGSDLEAVEIEHGPSGRRRIVECDTLVLTGDWIPDHELARAAGLATDPASRGPLVDTALRTSHRAVFAVGNLVHPVDTADVAALDGAHVAAAVVEWLAGERPPAPDASRIRAVPPLRWIAPGLVRAGDSAASRHRFLAWTDTLIRVPRVTVRQNGRIVAQRRLPWPASPGRVFRIPSDLLQGAVPGDGDIHVGL